MKRKNTSISLKKDIDFIFKNGTLFKTLGIRIFYMFKGEGFSRILVSFPRGFKGSVQRNRIKRLTKEVFRLEDYFRKNIYDLAVIVYPESKGKNFYFFKDFIDSFKTFLEN